MNFRENEGYNKLVAWGKENGAVISDSLKFVETDNAGSTLIAIDDITGDKETLISCPEKLVIGNNAVFELFGYGLEKFESKQIALAFFLIHQRILKEKSFWEPYINILPTEESFTTPLYFDKDDLVWLEGTNIYEDIEARRASWELEWENNIGALPEPFEKSLYTLEQYIWASSIFTSRSFPSRLLYSDSDQSLSMLLPLVDSLNHKPFTPIHWNATVGKSFDIQSAKPLKKHEEIFNNYGAKGNEELLMGYGFCLEDNQFDNVAIKLRLPPHVADKAKNLGIEVPENLRFNVTREDPLPQALFETLKVAVLKQGEALNSVRCRLNALEVLKVSLLAKYQKHAERNPSREGKNFENYKQQASKIYRDSQTKILYEAFAACVQIINEYEASLVGSSVITLKKILTDPNSSDFAESIEVCFGTDDSTHLIESGLEDQIIMLYIGWQKTLGDLSPINSWIKEKWATEQKRVAEHLNWEDEFTELYDSMFPQLASACPDVFGSEEWSRELLGFAGNILQSEGYVKTERTGTEYCVVIENNSFNSI
ncbi:SET domain-containing protein [Nadsonia fulvescens var. elongata DSM 6958]|uniref:SET domain-containing protein n=1 Tax=Nadsonia fulvescens var. elongata DSM 6958 TaxID=857566 RepID=A0A1E3PP50_9ASCO|nr:SET domain-containing protein [Nadsonia fulvescens var. elongata DSM 6958]